MTKLATYEHDGTVVCGIVTDDAVRPLRVDALTAIADGIDGLRAFAADAGAPVPLAEIRLLPPVPAPAVRDFVAFEEHMEGMRRRGGPDARPPDAWWELPTFYFSNPHALVGAHDDVPVPPGCALFDFELEVGVVIGTPGRDLDPAAAREHIVGYTIFNDWSARDLQFHEMQIGLGPCKGKDSATTLGPWLVTADELEPYRDADGYLRLAMTVDVNGVEVGRDLLSNIGWPFEVLVSYASRGAELRTGDVLGSGTCGNGGCLAELWARRGRQDPPSLQPGDVVTMRVEGIGEISNRVVAGLPGTSIPRARASSRQRP